MSNHKPHVQAERQDAYRVRIHTRSGLPIMLFATEQVPIDRASLAEIGNLAGIADSIDDLRADGFLDHAATVNRCVLTPDFHKGAGIPVGTVLETDGIVFPRAAGRDIGCGMRFMTLDMDVEEFDRLDINLDNLLRHGFFQGGRDLPLSEFTREAMLRHGIAGLTTAAEHGGLWERLDAPTLQHEIDHSHRNGTWPTDNLWMFSDYVRGSGGVSRDAAIASIGGGNHFVEVQRVSEVIEGRTAWDWGIAKGKIALMIHTGSLDLGAAVGDHFCRMARAIHPARIPVPQHGFHPLPLHGKHAPLGHAYLSAMGLAANFAAANRLALGLVALACLSKAAGRHIEARLVYDAPHNLAWADGSRVLHRKGACPAEATSIDARFPNGIPVIIPGSMGDESWIFRGAGGEENLMSAPHGAGRVASRGEARRASPRELEPLRIITKADPLRTRRDIAAELTRDLLEEGPSMYKSIAAVADTCIGAAIASPVAKLRPLLTVKG